MENSGVQKDEGPLGWKFFGLLLQRELYFNIEKIEATVHLRQLSFF